MIDYPNESFTLTTAEDQADHFTGDSPEPTEIVPSQFMPPGTYRVIAGEVFRIVSGASPSAKPESPPAP